LTTGNSAGTTTASPLISPPNQPQGENANPSPSRPHGTDRRLTFYDEAEQYLCSAPLRPGNVTAAVEARGILLMQELRLKAAHTSWARAQVWTLRERLFKLGARVLGSVRRVVLHLPTSFLFLSTFRQVALALGASPE